MSGDSVTFPGMRVVVRTERGDGYGIWKPRSLDEVMEEAERRGIDPGRPFWMVYDRRLAFAEFQQGGTE